MMRIALGSLVPLLVGLAACSASTGVGGEETAATGATEALTSAQMQWTGAPNASLTLALGSNSPTVTQASVVGDTAYQVYVMAIQNVHLGPSTAIYVDLANAPATQILCAQASISERVRGFDSAANAWVDLGGTDISGVWVPSSSGTRAHCQTRAAILTFNHNLTALEIMAQGRRVQSGVITITGPVPVTVNVVTNVPVPPQPSIRVASDTFADYGVFNVTLANDGAVDAPGMEVDITGQYLYCNTAHCALKGLGATDELPDWLDADNYANDYKPNPPLICPMTPATSYSQTVPAHGSASFPFIAYTSDKCPTCVPGDARCAAVTLSVSTHTTSTKLPGQYWDNAPYTGLVGYPHSLGFDKTH